MDKPNSSWRILYLLLLALIMASGVNTSVFADTYQYTIDAGSYEIVDAGDGYQEIKMEGFGQLLEPGKPKLPSKIFSIAIPVGVKVDSAEVAGGELTELDGTYRIVPAPVVRPLSATEEEIELIGLKYEDIVQEAYASDTPYPIREGVFKQQGAYRKYNLVEVRYSPFYYKAKSKKLYIYPTLAVTVNYSYSSAISSESEKLMEDYVPEAEERAAEFIINYQDAQKWYPAPIDAPIATTGGFVLITTNALEDSVWPIKNWETCKGRDVHVETVEDIDVSYSGVDRAERMRNFLRTYLSSWNILKVMLVGDITDVPMRYTYPNGPDGPDKDTTPWELEDRVPTDYYYAELSSSDYYSWNSNHDSMYGQQGVDSVQFPNEVDVARIPWSDPDIVENICMKMVEFEYSTDMNYKLNYLFTGAFFWSDTDNAVVKTYIINNALDTATYGYPVLIYEQNPSCWDSSYWSDYAMSRYITREVWGDDYGDGPFGYVNLAGHGSSVGVYYKERHSTCSAEVYFYGPHDCSHLDDSHPSIVFSNACSTAYPENNNLGKRLLEQGAVSFVGSTRAAFGAGGWDDPSDGNSSTLDWLFSDKAARTDGSRSSVGWAHQRALRDMYSLYNWDNSWWQFFEWNIYSNPDLWLNNRPGALPNLDYFYRTGWDYPIVPRSAGGATGWGCTVTSKLPGNTANTYYNWTWENNGTYNAPRHKTTLSIDNQWLAYSEPCLGAGASIYHSNVQSNPITTGGRHTLYYHIDEDEEAWETYEGDNCWGRQFVWSPYALADDAPVTRAAGPHASAGGCGFVYYNNDGFSFYVQSSYPNKYWSAVGVLPFNSAADYDLRLYDIGNYTGSEAGFGGGYLEYSDWGGATSDFVIVNRNKADAGTYTVGAINYNNATGNYHIEEATSSKIQAGTNGPYSMSSTAVLDIYETNETLSPNYGLSDGTWGIKLEQTAGTCDLGMSIYSNETVHASKSEYMADANSNGDGEDEYMEVTITGAPSYGAYCGLVVWKADSSDYSKTTTYNIKMGKCATPGVLYSPSPADGATSVSVNADLNWGDSANTEYYEVWLMEEGGTWQSLGATEYSAWTLSTLKAGTAYTWVIKAVNICGGIKWGPWWNFTTEGGAYPCEGDFDGDKDVDGSDLATFAADFGRTDCGAGPPCEGDFDGDKDVDGSDLAVFAADFGRTDCP